MLIGILESSRDSIPTYDGARRLVRVYSLSRGRSHSGFDFSEDITLLTWSKFCPAELAETLTLFPTSDFKASGFSIMNTVFLFPTDEHNLFAFFDAAASAVGIGRRVTSG